MNEKMINDWLNEEKEAHIHGWEFSHLEGRMEQGKVPWDYADMVRRELTKDKKLLDIDTGGGEFLLSLGHEDVNTAATEGFAPNVQLCREVLAPRGIDFRPADASKHLPFDDESFDIVIDRHGDLCPKEIVRVLKKGGIFITQQVGAENDRQLVSLLLGETPLPFPEQYLSVISEKFEKEGMAVTDSGEAFIPVRFFDTGALVWFAHVIEWEFPGFSVEKCLPGLNRAQRLIEQNGVVEATAHRFFIKAVKK